MSDRLDVQTLLQSVPLSRRTLLRRAVVLGVGAPVIGSLLAACETDDADDDPPAVDPDDDAEPDDEDEPVEDDADEEPDDEAVDPDDEDEEPVEDDEEARYGGTLNVAIVGNPPAMDVTTTTASVVGFFSWHIWEPLFTWNFELEPVPHLAESHEVSEDGLTNTIELRQGVPFHNGDEMAAADVVASTERWFEVSPRPAGLIGSVDSVEQDGDHTVVFNMSEPYGAFVNILSRQTGGNAIMPASIAETAGDSAVEEYIGTGPYQFVEYIPDRHIHLERFDDYASRDEEPSGYSGRRTAYIDEILFIPVPDAAARISGLQAGEYQYLESVSPDHYDTLVGDESVVVELLDPINYRIFVFNTAEGINANPTMRKALQAVFDHDELATAGHGDHYRLDPGILIQGTAWHTTVGEEHYNIADPDLARQHAEEAGYDGDVIRFMTSPEQPDMYDMSIVGQQQLEDAGFEIELISVDWATLFERRADPALWDIFVTGAGLVTDPLLMSFIQATTWPGWWDTERKVDLVRQIQVETDFDARYALWEELQLLFYEEDVPMIKIADMEELNARSPRLQGFVPISQVAGGVGFWNMWLED